MFRHIACAISGGVDSAVAAILLKQRGFDVTGVFMRNWDVQDEHGQCSADVDRDDAQYICKKLKIPFLEVSFVKEYWTDVFSVMVDEYRNGATPNPDIMCNRQIKFDAFFRYARKSLGADAIATGHYAKNSFGDFLQQYSAEKGAHLLRSMDQLKDQTFFLSQIEQKALQRSMFPVGDLTKSVVKQIAEANDLHRIVRRKESMGICFIGSRNFQKFMQQYVSEEPGVFVNVENKEVIGEHSGAHLWTIGQRCHLGGKRKAFFVVDKLKKSNEILVAEGTNHPALYTESLTTGEPHWIHSAPEELSPPVLQPNSLRDLALLEKALPLRCSFRFQHKHPLIDCDITLKKPLGSFNSNLETHLYDDCHRNANISSNSNEVLHVQLSRPLRAITPGQYAVFYKGEECLGSARIMQPGPSLFTQVSKFTETDQRFT